MSTGPVTIFCDGSACGDAGGGVGAVLIGPRSVLRLANYLRPVAGFPITNQVAELMAALVALKRLRPGSEVRLYSDSAYLINCFREGWYLNWQRKNWRKPGGREVAHRALWETLLSFDALHSIEWIHMRGHGRGWEPRELVRWNAICDNLAHTARVERRSWERRTTR